METERVSLARKKIAENLVRAQKEAPAAMCGVQVGATKLLESKKLYKMDACLIYALAAAVLKVPEVNVRWVETPEGPEIQKYGEELNLGIAVGAKNTLAVVTLHNTDWKNIAELNQAAASFLEKAKTGKFSPGDFIPQPNIVLNNMSSLHWMEFGSPLLLPGVTLMVSIFAIKKMPTPTMNVTVTFDHRPLDARPINKFLGALKRKIENPQF